MAYTFLDLVNEVARNVNEVELTSSNFSTATGFYSQVKDGFNRALSEIDTAERYWPFNFNQGTETLVAGTSKYTFPATSKLVDFDSFVIPEDDSLGNNTFFLRNLTYDDYKQNYIRHEFSSDTSLRDIPRFVVRSPSNEYILVPTPDKAYTVRFDYYGRIPTLADYDDVPIVPEAYRALLVNGALREAALFRENLEEYQVYEQLFRSGLKDMRTAEINQNIYARPRRNFRIPRAFPGKWIGPLD